MSLVEARQADRPALTPLQWELLLMLAVSSNGSLVTQERDMDANVLALADHDFVMSCPEEADPARSIRVWRITLAGRAALAARNLSAHRARPRFQPERPVQPGV